MGYLANFMVYTLAMIGVIAVALLVFKNSTSLGGGTKSKYLKVVDSLSISPRKRLYVISTGKEQFLIAGDVDKTTLISKLDTNCLEEKIVNKELNYGQNLHTNISNKNYEYPISRPIEQSFKETMANLPQNNHKQSYIDRMDNNIGIKSSILNNANHESAYTSVIRNLAVKMKQ